MFSRVTPYDILLVTNESGAFSRRPVLFVVSGQSDPISQTTEKKIAWFFEVHPTTQQHNTTTKQTNLLHVLYMRPW